VTEENREREAFHLSKNTIQTSNHTYQMQQAHILSQRKCSDIFLSPETETMVWLMLVESIELFVSCAKVPYKRDYILQNRPVILSIQRPVI